MIRHWRIRYNDRDEYVMTKDQKGNQLEQVVRHCVICRYALDQVIVIETATQAVHTSLMTFIKEAIKQ